MEHFVNQRAVLVICWVNWSLIGSVTAGRAGFFSTCDLVWNMCWGLGMVWGMCDGTVRGTQIDGLLVSVSDPLLSLETEAALTGPNFFGAVASSSVSGS